MKQKLKMLVKIADLQMSLWNMRGWNAEPSYQATCVAKRNKWHDVKCRALSIMATKAEQEAGTTPFQALKGRIRSIVAKYVSKNGRMSEAECASLSGMSCLQYDYDRR